MCVRCVRRCMCVCVSDCSHVPVCACFLREFRVRVRMLVFMWRRVVVLTCNCVVCSAKLSARVFRVHEVFLCPKTCLLLYVCVRARRRSYRLTSITPLPPPSPPRAATWASQTARPEGDTDGLFYNVIFRTNVVSARAKVGGVSIRSRNGALSRKGCLVNGQIATVR